MTEASMPITLDAREVDLKLLGQGSRHLSGHIFFRDVKALDEQGVDHWSALTPEQQEAARVRLWCAFIADAHPYGDSVEAVV